MLPSVLSFLSCTLCLSLSLSHGFVWSKSFLFFISVICNWPPRLSHSLSLLCCGVGQTFWLLHPLLASLLKCCNALSSVLFIKNTENFHRVSSDIKFYGFPGFISSPEHRSALEKLLWRMETSILSAHEKMTFRFSSWSLCSQCSRWTTMFSIPLTR